MVGSSACRVDTEVAITVADDGGGTVAVSVGLDEEAMARVPALEEELRLDDLAATGWEISGPNQDDGGVTRVVATKPFANPAEAAIVLAQVTGPEGPLRDLRLSRERSFARTRFEFDGTVDLTGGLESFGDEELARLLDGEPLGADEGAIEAALGSPLEEAFGFRVELRLPGSPAGESSGEGRHPVVWEPSLADEAPTVLQARSTSWRVGTLLAGALALASVVALGLLVLSRLLGRSRRDRARRGPPGPAPASSAR